MVKVFALEVEGYVDVRPGSGIMVTTPTEQPAIGCKLPGGCRATLEVQLADIERRDLAASRPYHLTQSEKGIRFSQTSPARIPFARTRLGRTRLLISSACRVFRPSGGKQMGGTRTYIYH